MNGLFYQAVDRIPLGPAVTLEVLGPLALSVFASRRAMNLVWAALALAGVFLLGGGGFDGLDPAGAAFALAAGAMWAAYIVFSARTGRRFPQADGLALAMAVGALLFLPLGIVESGSKLIDPVTLTLGSRRRPALLRPALHPRTPRAAPSASADLRHPHEPGARHRRGGRFPHPRPGTDRHPVRRHRPGHRGEHGSGADPGGAAPGEGASRVVPGLVRPIAVIRLGGPSRWQFSSHVHSSHVRYFV